MNRRTFIKGIFSGLTVLGVGVASRTGLAASVRNQKQKQNEKGLSAATLKKQLLVRTKEEEKFVDKVVQLRNNKKLSEKSVNAAYTRAMKERSKRFAYFSAAIKKLAKQEGVNL